MIFAWTTVPTYGCRSRNAAQLDERCRQEAAQTDVDDQTALDDLDDRTLDDLVALLLLLDRAPRPLVLRPLLRQDEAALFVLLGEDERFDLLAERDDLGRIDVVADAQLARRDDTFALVPDVEQHFVTVDLDDGAVDHLTVLDFDDGAVDGVGERHAEIVGDDLSGGVVALLVERPHLRGRGGGAGRGVGQGVDCFRVFGQEARRTGSSATLDAISGSAQPQHAGPQHVGPLSLRVSRHVVFRPSLRLGARRHPPDDRPKGRISPGGPRQGTRVTPPSGATNRRHRARRC